ncbi:MOSC domain-containing protein [Stappia sp. ES.058]|uniref:MOSC domain-containing protein n=1 Tax=Stappia sp. ES.058 TaxID=1881061 RepID=UPI00087A0FF4|nr:MOSC domain-containing protein [Stappia sp. ES.058]SDU40342.1 MOSC domain-containing protein YiiM [Stappia sp. ES.058]
MSHEQIEARVEGLFAGAVADRWEGRSPSAIAKQAVVEAVEIGFEGLVVDAQADRTVHGGADKALHHYAADHYATWIAEGYLPAGTKPAAFGENLSTFGLTEDRVCIGDIFRLGTSRVQICQGRQPCWKLNAHRGRDDMAAAFQKTGRTGWYYRVLETGRVAVGDAMDLIERPCPQWTVLEVTRARLTKRIDPARAAQLSALPELAGGWREAFAKISANALHEDTSARLLGAAD